MAGKKNFSSANVNRVFNTINEATAEPQEANEVHEVNHEVNEVQDTQEVQKPRTPYTDDKAQEMREAGTTQGRKGCKAVRINMAFSPEVHTYIKTMARVRGESVTDFTNYVFKQSMKDNAELYEKAKEFQDSFQ